MNTENQSFTKNYIKNIIHKTHNKMIDYYSNQIESFRITFNDYFDELIDEFFKSYDYMLNDYLEKIAKMNNKLKPIEINQKNLKYVLKYKYDDKNQSFIKNNIKFMIHQTHYKMIHDYSNEIESFSIIFHDKLIDEFFESYNYMLYDYLKKIKKMNDKFKHKLDDDDENNKTIDFNNIIINI